MLLCKNDLTKKLISMNGRHEDITALMGELNALTEEYNLEQDAIRYRLKECKVPKIQALISMYNDVQERMHNAAESDPKATWNENAENTALLAEYALDFAILAADRALLLSLKAIQEQKEASKIELDKIILFKTKKGGTTMKEVKSPKKPLIYYYVIVLLVLAAFNFFVSPLLLSRQVTEVDYGTFMSMTEKKNIGRVEVEDSQIIFTDKNNDNIYKTGVMDDPNLTERLYQSGATFSKDIEQTMSPIMSFLLTFILPMVIFCSWTIPWKKAFRTGWWKKIPWHLAWERATPEFMFSLLKASILMMLPVKMRQRKILLRLLIIFIIPKNILMPVPLCLKVCCL